MKIINVYGVGRTRDKYGNVTKWSYNPYINIAEIYEQD